MRTFIDFARDEEGMKACKVFYNEYHSRVEERYSKDKQTATSPDEEEKVKIYNDHIRKIIEETVMDEMVEERRKRILESKPEQSHSGFIDQILNKLFFVLICLTALMVGCNKRQDVKRVETAIQKEQIDNDYNSETMEGDSFIVNYRNKVRGYSVKGVVEVEYSSDYPLLTADFCFTKGEQSFILHSMSYGDSVFSKGRYDPDGYNIKTLKKYRGKTIEADYNVSDKGGDTMTRGVPFFFKDLDFDDVPELVIVHSGMAVRYHDGYDVYRIVDGKPVLLDYPPYNQDKEEWGFGMTDYPVFDYQKKTIACYYPEGEQRYDGCMLYGVSKKEKDVVIVNGRKHYFNKMERIKDVK